MPHTCCAVACTNRHSKDSGITFHRFPFRNNALLKTWVHALRRKEDWQPDRGTRLCSHHFEQKFFKEINGRRYLTSGAIPSIFNFPPHLMKTIPKERQSRKRCRSPGIPSVEAEHPDAEHPEVSFNPEVPSNTAVQKHSMKKDHAYSFSTSPAQLTKKLHTAVERCRDLVDCRKIKNQTVRRQKRKIRNLENIVQDLKSKLDSHQGSMIIENCFSGILKDLLENQNSGHVIEYSPNVRQFALTLHFYSAKAYDYLRTVVKLPHPSTLCRWATAVGGKPGFTEESFQKIAEEVKAIRETKDINGNPGRLICCLMVDEMNIKKQVDFDGKEIVGYSDLGHGYISDDEMPMATHSLVFLVTAINKNWKLPLGYCLVEGLEGSVRANLAKMYLDKLHEVGAECVAMTCDGTSCNLTMFRELGVKFDSTERKNWFNHPSNEAQKVYAILDPAHMLKLMRNLIGEKGIILDSSKPTGNDKIEWTYFKNLNKLQEEEGLHAANKLRRSHIQFQKQKMKVALAAQTLSKSVSSALHFCEQSDIDGFAGSSTTADFALIIDDIFDLLNSCHVFGKGSKSPIRKGNKDLILERISKGIQYLEGLREPGLNGKPILEGRRKVPALGFIIDLMSVRDLSEELVWGESAPLVCFLTKKISQDHLELFFSCIRKRTGDNNNPTALEFRRAYRKCLIARISPSSRGNCQVDSTEMLLLGDGTGSIAMPKSREDVLLDTDHSYVPEYESLSRFADNVIEYIAGFVARVLLKRSNCPQCSELVHGSNARSLIKLKDCGGLIVPSEDLIRLCQSAERVFRSTNTMRSGTNWLLKLQCETISMISTTNIFKNEHLFTAVSPGGEQHYSTLLKTSLEIFFKLRLHHMCRQVSQLQRGETIRQQLTKLILFKGQ